jgi:hypothetical protein
VLLQGEDFASAHAPPILDRDSCSPSTTTSKAPRPWWPGRRPSGDPHEPPDKGRRSGDPGLPRHRAGVCRRPARRVRPPGCHCPQPSRHRVRAPGHPVRRHRRADAVGPVRATAAVRTDRRRPAGSVPGHPGVAALRVPPGAARERSARAGRDATHVRLHGHPGPQRPLGAYQGGAADRHRRDPGQRHHGPADHHPAPPPGRPRVSG